MKKKLTWFFNRFEEAVISASLFVMFILTAANALSRYLLRYSVRGIDEIVVLCFTWTVFLGASACYKRNMHYGIDVLINALPVKGKRVLILFIHILLLILFCYLAYLSADLALSVQGRRVTSYYNISYFWVDLPAAVGFSLMALSSLRFISKDLSEPVDFMKPLIEETDYIGEYVGKDGENADIDPAQGG